MSAEVEEVQVKYLEKTDFFGASGCKMERVGSREVSARRLFVDTI
jgi:hypothetical protein